MRIFPCNDLNYFKVSLNKKQDSASKAFPISHSAYATIFRWLWELEKSFRKSDYKDDGWISEICLTTSSNYNAEMLNVI